MLKRRLALALIAALIPAAVAAAPITELFVFGDSSSTRATRRTTGGAFPPARRRARVERSRCRRTAGRTSRGSAWACCGGGHQLRRRGIGNRLRDGRADHDRQFLRGRLQPASARRDRHPQAGRGLCAHRAGRRSGPLALRRLGRRQRLLPRSEPGHGWQRGGEPRLRLGRSTDWALDGFWCRTYPTCR